MNINLMYRTLYGRSRKRYLRVINVNFLLSVCQCRTEFLVTFVAVLRKKTASKKVDISFERIRTQIQMLLSCRNKVDVFVI